MLAGGVYRAAAAQHHLYPGARLTNPMRICLRIRPATQGPTASLCINHHGARITKFLQLSATVVQLDETVTIMWLGILNAGSALVRVSVCCDEGDGEYQVSSVYNFCRLLLLLLLLLVLPPHTTVSRSAHNMQLLMNWRRIADINGNGTTDVSLFGSNDFEALVGALVWDLLRIEVARPPAFEQVCTNASGMAVQMLIYLLSFSTPICSRPDPIRHRRGVCGRRTGVRRVTEGTHTLKTGMC